MAFLLLKHLSYLVFACWELSSIAGESRSKDCLRGELTWGVLRTFLSPPDSSLAKTLNFLRRFWFGCVRGLRFGMTGVSSFPVLDIRAFAIFLPGLRVQG